jgi:ABC-type multidrug transport system fused ATPase/permease subunit
MRVISVVFLILVVVLGISAVVDAVNMGLSYPTAVLSVVVAVAALVTLLTAPDGGRLHRQLDEVINEVSRSRSSASALKGAINTKPTSNSGTMAALLLGAILALAFCRRNRRRR